MGDVNLTRSANALWKSGLYSFIAMRAYVSSVSNQFLARSMPFGARSSNSWLAPRPVCDVFRNRHRSIRHISLMSSSIPSALVLAYSPPTSMYIHLPFCAQRCHYCNFTVTVSNREETHRKYVDSVIRELEIVAKNRSPNAPPLSTVYLGGGTPSLLTATEIARVIDSVYANFSVANDAEITTEMDPATFDFNRARDYRSAGVNRVSVGVQSTDNDALALCGRIHRRHDIFTALSHLENAKFSNISIDLISGLPNVPINTFLRSLAEMIQIDVVQHVSIYDLTLEPGTAFGRRYRAGTSPLPREEESVACLSAAAQKLRNAEFDRYEISNYARSGFRSRHNIAYWKGSSFYGLGVGATSFVDGIRFARPKTIPEYARFIRDGANIPQTVRNENEILEDFLINRFRLLMDGVPLSSLPDALAKRLVLSAQNAGFLKDGLMLFEGNKLRMTDDGAMIENAILGTLLQDTLWSDSFSSNTAVR